MCEQNNLPQDENTECAETEKEPVEATVPSAKKKSKAGKIIARILLIIGIILFIILIAGVVTLFVMRSRGKNSLKVEDYTIVPPTEVEVQTDPEDDTLVYYKGEKYAFKDDVVAFVVMGVDKEDINEDIGAGANGQADAIFLVVADPGDGSVDMISVSRDSIVEVDKYTTTGVRDGTEKMQLCLAYAYGDGSEKSIENVQKSVSRLFYGVPISGYVAIDLDAISVLNDAVGGVTVPEYTADGSEKTGGQITLNGDDAELYLRRRNTAELDSNNARMERQNYYINAFISKAVEMTKKDISTPLNIYDSLTDYMMTDVTADEVVYLTTEYLGGVENMAKHSVQGTVSEGEDGYAEFTPEPVALYEMILELFYEKK